MTNNLRGRPALAGLFALALWTAGGASAEAGVIYSNGFETNTVDWSAGTRVASGTNGIPSASGGFHAQMPAGAFTRWGGYNFGAGSVPTAFQEFTTSLDIYLNVGGGYANDTRFDYTSAVSNSAGGHRRDFAFAVGFYNDGTGPGAGTDRFVVSASNNTPGFPKNPMRDPFAISTTGWYTFEHHFYDNGGVLAVDMNIYDAGSNLLHSWTLSDPMDLIGLIGGNRYGWFPNSAFPYLALDNGRLTTADAAAIPEPATLALFGAGLVGVAVGALRRRNARPA